MNRLRRRARSEAGASLAEILVAITVISLAVVAIVEGLGGAARASDIHRKDVTADNVVRGWAESIKQYVRLGSYQECVPGDTSPPDYKPNPSNAAKVAYAVPAGYALDYGASSVQYQSSSNLNLVLAIDRSGSLYDQRSEVKAAAKAFLEGLANTGTVVSLVSFGTRATVDAEPTSIVDPTSTPAIDGTLKTLEDRVDATAFVDAGNSEAGTNWDDALAKALGQVGKFSYGPAPLVVIITDGDPTYYIDDATGNVAGPGSYATADTIGDAVDQAKLLADAAHSHIFAVGVGSDSEVKRENLQAISGHDEYTGAGSAVPFADDEGNFVADWMQVSDFTALKTALTEIATKFSTDEYAATCPASGDQGAQRLSLRATSSDGRVWEEIELVVRRP